MSTSPYYYSGTSLYNSRETLKDTSVSLYDSRLSFCHAHTRVSRQPTTAPV
jgi:hypothetical protein